MSSQQILKRTRTIKDHPPPAQASTPPQNKEEQFMNYFDSIRNSKVNSHKTSRVTTSSDYNQVFHDYAKKQSEIDKVIETFDNDHIYNFFEETHGIITSNAFLSSSQKIKHSVESINKFFIHSIPLEKAYAMPDLLDHEHYSHFLVSSILPNEEKAEQNLYENKLERIESQRVAFKSIPEQKKASQELQSKIDLILAEIASQKRRKEDVRFYEEAMNIRLNELVDYITEDDEKYLGLSLNSKAFQILKNISSFKAKTIEGYLKLPLLQYFFSQFKELQEHRASKLRSSQKREDKKEVCSQLRLKSSHASKKGKYSQPNSKRNSHVIRQQDWIGKLQ